MVLDLLPLHRQIRTCHGFIRSLVNDGGNTGGGSRQRRTVGGQKPISHECYARPYTNLTCVCIYIYIYTLLAIFVKSRRDAKRISSRRGDAKLTRRRPGALRVSWPASITSLSYRCVIVDDDGNNLKRMRQVDDSRVGRKPFGKLDEFI